MQHACYGHSSLQEHFAPKSEKSLMLRTHCQTSGWSLTAQDVYNNVGRTCLEALAAVDGHTQSLHTNAFDEALALPTDFSARIARNTQIILQTEAHLTDSIDPWGGSFYMERLTHDLSERARQHIREVENLGGMAKALEQGLPQRRIETAATETQARLDTGARPLIGVNLFSPEDDPAPSVLKIDNAAVRHKQIERLKTLKSMRSEDQVREKLDALTQGAATGEGNLLALCLDAATRLCYGRRDVRSP